MKIGDYVMVHSKYAGVFVGKLKSRKGTEAVLSNARRIWYWAGAASLSELSQRGTSNPGGCKFPVPVKEVLLTEVIEVLNVPPQAKKSIEAVPVWSK